MTTTEAAPVPRWYRSERDCLGHTFIWGGEAPGVTHFSNEEFAAGEHQPLIDFFVRHGFGRIQ